jgi:signal transduction histidine kinase/ligand-binding sensor domain-containing protein
MLAICLTFKRFFLVAVSTLIPITIFAAADSEWSLHSWRSDDGLPNNNVISIAQTRNSYLWVANPTALARFDGVQFETFSPKLFGLDAGERVCAVAGNRDDGLWLATGHAVVLAKGQQTQIFTNLSPGWVPQTMLEDDEGSVWMTFNYGVVCRLKKNGELTHFTTREGMPDGPVCSLAKDSKGQIWFAKSGQKNGQVGVLRDGYFQTLLKFGRPIIRLAAGRNGDIWICNGSHLLKFREGEEPEDMGNFLPDRPTVVPSALLVDSHGAVWIGTADNGLFRFDGSKFDPIPTSYPQISDLIEDHEGNIWVATLGGGLDRLRPREIELQGIAQGLPFESVVSLCQDTNKILWAATQNGLLAYYKDGMWNALEASNSFFTNVNWRDAYVTCVASGNDAVWVGTKNRTIYCIQNQRLSTIGQKSGLISRRIRSLLVASNGDVWIGGEEPDSLQRLRNGNLKTFPVPPNIRLIRTMAEDSAGNIWAGTSGGSLLRIAGDTLTDETAKLNGELSSIRSLCATPDGSVWIGSPGDGLGCLKNGNFNRLTSAQGLYDDYISQIVADDHGCLWFGSDRGIFKVQLDELNAVADGKSVHIHSTHYGSDEGLANLQANFDVSPGAIRSSDGRVWIPTRTGLAVINPEILSEDPQPPPVLLRQVKVDEKIVAADGSVIPVQNAANLQNSKTVLRLPPSHRLVEFEFTAINFSAPENIYFRFKLDGFDDNWVESETRNAIYPRLPAGKYQFHVEARNGSGLWNEASAPLTLVVTPFFWQTWWFRLAALALFTSIVIAVVRYISFRRLRRKLHTLEQQAALDNERARIARDIHDDLGGSMTQITLLSGLISRDISKPEKATGYAQRISSAAKNVTDSLDEIVWAVNPRNDTLPHLINYLGKFTSEYLTTSGLKCKMNLPQHPRDQFVSSDMRHNLFLAVKEALNNAARHSNASEVSLQIVVDEKTMGVTIADNGRGFNAAPQNGTAEGLHNMRQRMQNIGGQFEIESKPGAGTKVNFVFPLSNSSNGK